MLIASSLQTFLVVTIITYQCAGNANDADLASHPGHMKPLGSVGPYFDIPILNEFPSTKEFFNKFVVPSIPVLIKGAVRNSKAFSKWTDEYFMAHPGSSEKVFIEKTKKENRTGSGETVPFHDFVGSYIDEDMYMVNRIPNFLRSEVELASPLRCDAVMNNLDGVVMWYSSGGTKSVVHNDDLDNLNCLYRGKKVMVFVNYHDVDDEWINNIIDQPSGGYSDIDVDAVDYVKYHALASTRYAVVNMTAGDCLFIPIRWFHQINSYGNNLAVNIWFAHLPRVYMDLTEEKCGSHDNVTLDKCYFETLDSKKKDQKHSGDGESESISSLAKLPWMTQIIHNVKKHNFHTVKDIQDLLETRVGLAQYLKHLLNATNTAVNIVKLLDINKDNIIDLQDFRTIVRDKLYSSVSKKLEKIVDKFIISITKAEKEDGKELVKMQHTGHTLTCNTKGFIRTLIDRGEISRDLAKVIFKEGYLSPAGFKEEL